MAFQAACQCDPDTVGHPTQGTTCPIIEQVKEDTKWGNPRTVYLEFRFAKQKGGLRTAVHRKLYEETDVFFKSALHWTLRIDNRCFDLHRIPGTHHAAFRSQDWDNISERYLNESPESRDVGLTYLSDEQIEKIGKHIIDMAYTDYDAVINNCQSFVIEVCKNILYERNDKLSRSWLGFKVYSALNVMKRAVEHAVDKVTGDTTLFEAMSIQDFSQAYRSFIAEMQDLLDPLREIKTRLKYRLLGPSEDDMALMMQNLHLRLSDGEEVRALAA